MCVYILGHAKPQNWFDPGVGRYCIPLYLGLDNKCTPSFLRLCGIGGDCFGLMYFSEGAQLRKKNTEVQNNHRRIHTMTETKMVQKLLFGYNTVLGQLLFNTFLGRLLLYSDILF